MKREKVYCPYCGPWNGHPEGVEMEDIYYYFECPVCKSKSPNVLWDIPSSTIRVVGKRKRAKLYALQRFKPPIKPLEINELRPGDVVWLEERDKCVCCVHLDYWSPQSWRENNLSIPIEFFRQDSAKFYFVPNYGKKWRCWRERPTCFECMAAEWEA